MKLSAALDAVERLVELSTDHPEMAERINAIVLGLLRNEEDGVKRVVRVIPDTGPVPSPRPYRGRTVVRNLFGDQPSTEPKFYSVHEAAPVLGFDHQTVSKWCRNGQLRAEKVWRLDRRNGRVRSWRIEGKEIDRFKAAGLLPVDVGRNGS